MSGSIDPVLSSPQVSGLDAAHQDILSGLFNVLARKQSRNRLRRSYYDYKSSLRDLGISVPPQLTKVETVLGWSAKAVDSMSRRTVLESFLLSDGESTADLGLDSILEENRFEALAPQAHTSALIHATAFGFVTAGDVEAGEPGVLLSATSAQWSTGTWDSRRRALSNALSIVSIDDKTGHITEMVLYLPNLTLIMRRTGQSWDIRQVTHDLGVPVEALPYRPSLDRPFGSSRISRPVMALTDSGVRTLLRTEVSAEFFNAPQRWALGADEGAFKDKAGNDVSGWQVMLGRLLTLSRDENGDLPTVGQFTQQSMVPNIDQFRMLAQAFASETSLPLRSLGVVGDNPESSEAIIEANKELELEIRHWETASLGPAWKRLAVNCLRMTDDSPAANEVYARIRPHWTDPNSVSVISAADAFVKKAAVIPDLGATSVGQEMAGMSADQIERYKAETRKMRAGVRLDALVNAAPVTVEPEPAPELPVP